MNLYFKSLKNYFAFKGRASRKEFWTFTLINIVIFFILVLIDGKTGGNILEVLFAGLILIPSLAVTVRRLHDAGKSGWWILIYFIPLIGALVMLVFLLQDSIPVSNEYGPNPKTI